MVQIAVKLDDDVKNIVTERAKKEWLTISFLVNFFLRSYAQWDLSVWVVSRFQENLQFTKELKDNFDIAMSDLENDKNIFTLEQLQEKYGKI